MKVYTEKKAEDFLKDKLPIAKGKLTKKLKEALEYSKKLKFPIVLKLMSDKVLHKSDIGAVKIVSNEDELKIQYNNLLRLAKSMRISRYDILIQRAQQGHETIVGAKRDPTFGPIVIFGAGGIYTELIKDTSIRICPVAKEEALKMIDETKFSKILHGYRGEKSNVDSLANIIVKVSNIMMKNKKIQELDLNPVFVNQLRAVVADARIILS